jgi:hypothetical protein
MGYSINLKGFLTDEHFVARDQVLNPVNSRRQLEHHTATAVRFRDNGYTTRVFWPNSSSSRDYGFDQRVTTFEGFLLDRGILMF